MVGPNESQLPGAQRCRLRQLAWPPGLVVEEADIGPAHHAGFLRFFLQVVGFHKGLGLGRIHGTELNDHIIGVRIRVEDVLHLESGVVAGLFMAVKVALPLAEVRDLESELCELIRFASLDIYGG